MFGRNVATYKFALGQSLLELGAEEHELVALEDLAVPFSRHLCRHLTVVNRQITSSNSRFLDTCRGHNAGSVNDDQLIEATVRLGFNNVIDAFHVLDGAAAGERFFLDERSIHGGIRLTDALHDLTSAGVDSFTAETESRWSLVEAAWELNLPRQLLTVTYDPATQALRAQDRRRRTAVTNARGALNGYQKGTCFYCFGPISIDALSIDLGEVDHVFAWSIGPTVGGAPVDGVWNLVLACRRCNGWHEKSNRPAHRRYVERLHTRNEFLIASHHPLRPTLISQTGDTPARRAATLRRAYNEATVDGVRVAWEAPDEFAPRF